MFFSSKSWGDSSDVVNQRPPHIYGRLVPTMATKERLLQRGIGMVDVLDSTRPRRPPDANKDFSSLTKGAVGGGPSVNSLHQSSAVSSAVASTNGGGFAPPIENPVERKQAGEDEGDEDHDEDKLRLTCESPNTMKFDFPFCCQRNWCSHSFLLPPGDYILTAFSEEYHVNNPGVINGMAACKVKPKNTARPHVPTGETPRMIFNDDASVNKGIWTHVTSTDAFSLSGLSVVDLQANSQLIEATPLREMKDAGLPLPEVWPFLSDQQQETGSKGLIDVITRVRREVDELNLQILELKYGNTVSYDIDDD